MRPENRNSEGECYQVNSKIKALYNDSNYRLVSLKINNNEIEDKELYSLCIQGYHFNNAKSYLNMTQEELLESGRNKVISTSAKEVLEEYLRNRQNLKVKVEGRLQYL